MLFYMLCIVLIVVLIIVLSITLPARNGNLQTIDKNSATIIIHFTSTQKRVNRLVQDTVDNMLTMKGPVDMIIITVHQDVNIDWYDPDDSKYKKVYINYISEDYGPATKYIGVLDMPDEYKKEWNLGSSELKNTYFFVCDDDMIYRQDLLTNMMKTSRTNARADLFSNATMGMFTNIIRGITGNLIRPSFFKPELKVLARPQGCFKIDDQWIKIYADVYNINIAWSGYNSPFYKDKYIFTKNNGNSGDGLNAEINLRSEMKKSCASDMRKHGYKFDSKMW